jgi:uncharacterized iron-regulated protein
MHPATRSDLGCCRVRRASGQVLAALLLTVLGMCGMPAAAAVTTATATDTAAQHFTGRVWDVAAARFIDAATLVQRARDADIVLLGETHDHPEHHALEQAMFAALMAPVPAAAPVSSLVMEQYDLDQQPLLDAARSALSTQPNTQDATLEQLGQLMGDGWDWALYRPLVAAAVRAEVPIRAANLPRPALQQVSRTGFAALGAGEAQRLALETGWTSKQQAQLEKNILAGHCGVLPVSAAPAVARAQRARDAVMADRLLAAAASSGAGPVLGIFGREHARRDLAVPLYLAARAPEKTVVSIGLVEIDDGAAPESLALGPLGRLHDYLVLTAPLQRAVDPCEGLVMPAAPAR